MLTPASTTASPGPYKDLKLGNPKAISDSWLEGSAKRKPKTPVITEVLQFGLPYFYHTAVLQFSFQSMLAFPPHTPHFKTKPEVCCYNMTAIVMFFSGIKIEWKTLLLAPS